MKKIVSLVLVLVLALTAIGGTLAYFTDTDNATNVMTVGKVDIELIEQERKYNDEGVLTGLGEFTNNKALFPIVGSAQGEKDKYGLPIAENYVDKIITVKNLEQDAYVAVYMAIPKALVLLNVNGDYALHASYGDNFKSDGTGAIADKGATYLADWDVNIAKNFAEVEIDGTDYVVQRYIYKNILDANEETETAAFVGMYLDQRLDYNTEKKCYEINGTEMPGVAALLTANDGKINFPVYAVGTQAEGFADAKEAIEKSFGATWTPWDAE